MVGNNVCDSVGQSFKYFKIYSTKSASINGWDESVWLREWLWFHCSSITQGQPDKQHRNHKSEAAQRVGVGDVVYHHCKL